MKEKKSKSYSLVKVANTEIFLDSQLQSAGANQARTIEKYEKNPNNLKQMAVFTKFIFAFLVAILTIMPLIIYLQVVEYMQVGLVSIETIIFAGSLLFGVYFGMQFGYILIGGLLFTSALMTGETFRWLETLPISREKLQKMSFKLVLRSMNASLLVLVSLFPLVMFFISQNVIVFLISICVMALNGFLFMSLMVFIGQRLSRVLSDTEVQTGKKTVFRLIYMGGYVIGTLGVMMMFSVIISSIDDIFAAFATSDQPAFINIILSLIPFPFAPAYFILAWTNPVLIPPELWLTTIIGFSVFVLITLRLYKGALRALRDVTSAEGKTVSANTIEVLAEDVEVQITVSTPIKSYIRKDLVTATRDITMLTYLIFPVIYPMIMLLVTMPNIGSYDSLGEEIMLFLIFSLMYTPMMAGFLTAGLLNVEESGATILGALPIIPRDQAKAKLIMMIVIITLSFVPPLLIYSGHPELLTFVAVVLSVYPMVVSMVLLMFAMKIRLFGKMKHKYILEELNIERKVGKWVLMVLTQIGMLVILLILCGFFMQYGIGMMCIGVFIVGAMLLISMFITINKMFPKERKMADYNTGGAMRENPIIGVIIISVLYNAFLIIGALLEIPIILLIADWNFAALLLVDFLFAFGILALLLLYVANRGLKLPYGKESFKQYAKSIHLTTNKPIIRNVLLGIAFTAIFCVVCLIGGIFMGKYIFMPEVLFGAPSADPLNFGWFLFITMLIPGIWEEVAFRGILMPILLKKYKPRTAIIINGIAFGAMHWSNALTLLVVFRVEILIAVFFQWIYATFIGFALAYLYYKTESLLPGIIAHYLIDSVGQLFLTIEITDPFLLGVFLIGCVGVIPAILNILLVKLVMRGKKKGNLITT